MSKSKKQKLILHLQNLKKQGRTDCTVNIDLLLDCLTVEETRTDRSKIISDVRVDGGSF
jgi:hypothetical protein